jgi:hypothetical protein
VLGAVVTGECQRKRADEVDEAEAALGGRVARL